MGLDLSLKLALAHDQKEVEIGDDERQHIIKAKDEVLGEKGGEQGQSGVQISPKNATPEKMNTEEVQNLSFDLHVFFFLLVCFEQCRQLYLLILCLIYVSHVIWKQLAMLRTDMNRIRLENEILRKVVEETSKDYNDLKVKFAELEKHVQEKVLLLHHS